MEKKISITVSDLERLLNQQKDIVINRLLQSTSYYNGENTPGISKSLPINRKLFKEVGFSAKHPDDLIILKKYLP